MYLLDTNVVSELRKAKDGKADRAVSAWAQGVTPSETWLSVISILELELEVLRIERRDQKQGEILRFWLEERIIPAFAERTLPIDTSVARQCARLRVPDPHQERDALIAATALVHGLVVVTRNVRDFVATGVGLLDPWQAPTA